MLYNEDAVRANIRNRNGKRVYFLAKGDQLTSGARDYLNRERIEILPAEQAKIERYRLLSGTQSACDAACAAFAAAVEETASRPVEG